MVEGRKGGRREVPYFLHLRKKGQGLKHLEQEKTDPRHSSKQPFGPLFPPPIFHVSCQLLTISNPALPQVTHIVQTE